MKTSFRLLCLTGVLCLGLAGCTPDPAADPLETLSPASTPEFITETLTPETDGSYCMNTLSGECAMYVTPPEGYTVDDMSSPYCLVAMSGSGEEVSSLTYMIDSAETLVDGSGSIDDYVSEYFSFYMDNAVTQYESSTDAKAYAVGDKTVYGRTLIYSTYDENDAFYSRTHMIYLWWETDDGYVMTCLSEEVSLDEQHDFQTEETLAPLIFNAVHR